MHWITQNIACLPINLVIWYSIHRNLVVSTFEKYSFSFKIAMYDIRKFTLTYVNREIVYNTFKQWKVDSFCSDRLPTEFLLQKASNWLEYLNITR